MPFSPFNYLYLRPSKNVVRGRTVTSTAGAPDAGHPLRYLTDDYPAFPARWAAGAWGASIALAGASDVQLYALGNTSLDAAVSCNAGSLGTPTTRVGGVKLNPFLLLASPGSVSTVTFGGTNTAPAIIGEAFAGVPEELPPLRLGSYWEEFFDGSPDDPEGDFMNIPHADEGEEWRRFGGSTIINQTVADQLVEWRSDQRSGSRPTAMIMDQSINDMRMVLLKRPKFTSEAGPGRWNVDLEWVEFPRYRWA